MTTAQTPFMITAAMKRQMRDLGYTDEQISEMRPAEAHQIIAASAATATAQEVAALRQEVDGLREQVATLTSIVKKLAVRGGLGETVTTPDPPRVVHDPRKNALQRLRAEVQRYQALGMPWDQFIDRIDQALVQAGTAEFALSARGRARGGTRSVHGLKEFLTRKEDAA